MDEATLRRQADRMVAALGGRRRLLAAALVAVGVLAGLRALTPPAAPTTAVWAAARDLAGGRPLTTHDLRRLALPRDLVPTGALGAGEDVVGRLLAAPMRAGEPLTDVRLLEPALLDAMDRPGLVAVPVHVADGSAAAALVHAGDVVDVLAVNDTSGGLPSTIAAAVRVLSVPAVHAASGDGGGLVVVAVSRTQAAALARASAGSRLSLALERP